MGRGRRNMELISNEKARNITYNKRKRGLEKKLYEISTLCGVGACMLIHGPKQNGHSCDLAAWPENDEEHVRALINRFKANTTSLRTRRTRDLSHYFIDRKKNIDKEISKKRMKSLESMYRTCDERIDNFSHAQVRIALGFLETKIEAVERKIQMFHKVNYMITNDAGMEIMGSSNFGSIPSYFPYTQGMLQRIVELEAINQQPISFVKPLDNPQWPNFYSSYQGDSSFLPSYVNPMADPLKIKAESCTLHGDTCRSGIQHTPLNCPIYYIPTVGVLDNVTVNNPMLPPPTFNYNPSMQLMPPNVQYSTMQTVSNHMPSDPQADPSQLYTRHQ